jgi:two-component system, chemotaxis family, protein-glutamate methylesterase/glutaminase
MNTGRWQSKRDGADLKVPFRSGVAIFIELAGDARLCLLSPDELKALKTDGLRALMKDVPKGLCRIIGSPTEHTWLGALLQKEGHTLGKHVSLEPPKSLRFLPGVAKLQVERSVAPPPTEKTRVLIVDDSKTIRSLLTRILEEDPDFEVVGSVDLPSKVEEAIRVTKPHVITLDIHMPEMDGVTLLKTKLASFRIPVVMLSAISKEDGTYVLDALASGAVDYIQKPSMQELPILAPIIREKLKIARQVNRQLVQATPTQVVRLSGSMDPETLIVIGSSTGGTEALKEVLTRLPKNIPPILIVQHIPPVFSKAFAERMNQLCPFEVKEGEDGDVVQPNRVIIAPGGFQMGLKKVGPDYRIQIRDDAPVLRHKPSVDYLFHSVSVCKPKKCVGVILTGMGADGASGLLKLRGLGYHTIAQNEATCVVYGMPREAIQRGAAVAILPLLEIAQGLVGTTEKK